MIGLPPKMPSNTFDSIESCRLASQWHYWYEYETNVYGKNSVNWGLLNDIFYLLCSLYQFYNMKFIYQCLGLSRTTFLLSWVWNNFRPLSCRLYFGMRSYRANLAYHGNLATENTSHTAFGVPRHLLLAFSALITSGVQLWSYWENWQSCPLWLMLSMAPRALR